MGRTDRDHEGLAKESNVQESGIHFIQENVMKALYMTPDHISLILSDVCELIARDSFHEKWPSFIPDLIEGLKQDNPDITLRVFRTLSPIMKKIRHMYRSDALYTQINYLIESFAPFLTEYTGKCIGFLEVEGLTKEQEEKLWKSIVDALSIYESLNTVEEFPDYFEETLSTWATYFCQVLDSTSDHEITEFIEAKKGVVDIVSLLMSRFAEYMGDYSQGFFEKIWQMIGKLPPLKVYNDFVASITEYLIVTLKDPTNREAIKKDLTYLFSEFLVHHMTFNEDDFDEFEGNEEAFIKMDLEENDKETRRRNCFNLVKVK